MRAPEGAGENARRFFHRLQRVIGAPETEFQLGHTRPSKPNWWLLRHGLPGRLESVLEERVWQARDV